MKLKIAMLAVLIAAPASAQYRTTCSRTGAAVQCQTIEMGAPVIYSPPPPPAARPMYVAPPAPPPVYSPPQQPAQGINWGLLFPH